MKDKLIKVLCRISLVSVFIALTILIVKLMTLPNEEPFFKVAYFCMHLTAIILLIIGWVVTKDLK